MTPEPLGSAVDPAALDRLRRIGGQGFLVEMIELFLEHAPQRLEAAARAFEARELRDVYRAAHSLKSTSGNLGARTLQATAEQLEGRAVAEDVEALPPLLEELRVHYERARAELEVERDRRKGAGT